jgi:hypothetical protein
MIACFVKPACFAGKKQHLVHRCIMLNLWLKILCNQGRIINNRIDIHLHIIIIINT